MKLFLDPWVSRKKKGKKKTLKKRQSTQDKIDSILFRHKNTRGKQDGSPGNFKSMPPPRDAIERACTMKEELLSQIESLGERLPPNTLDQLIDELGGPENVAEVFYSSFLIFSY